MTSEGVLVEIVPMIEAGVVVVAVTVVETTSELVVKMVWSALSLEAVIAVEL